MINRAEKAREYFLQGYNCSQSMVLAFEDLLGVNRETILNISLPFGGGMGRLRQTCGAVSGGIMCLGLLFPNQTKSEAYARTQELAKRFREKNGSINCGELLTGVGVSFETQPQVGERAAEYYKKRPCPDLVYDCAEILAQMCKEEGIGE